MPKAHKCCSVSQCVAVCCSVEQCVAVRVQSAIAGCNFRTIWHSSYVRGKSPSDMNESCPCQRTATYCNILQHNATHCNTLQHTATHCNCMTNWRSSYAWGESPSDTNESCPCNTLQHTVTHGNTRQHTATRCNTLQHTATHCNCRTNWRVYA